MDQVSPDPAGNSNGDERRRTLNELDPNRSVGEEARKANPERLRNGFIATYLSGPAILDIGYRGYRNDVVPIVPGATGVDLDYPDYDGVTLPFPAGSQDAVFSSHCLEHIADFQNAIRDWFRVLKVGGYLVIMVPHKFLYEKQTDLPSRFNADHKRFYTPASLMVEIETSLQPNTYRLRRLVDNDAEFDYTIPPARHSGGCYELELVLEKITAPNWHLAKPLAGPSMMLPEYVVARKDQIVVPRHGRAQFTEVIEAGSDDVIRYDFGTAVEPNSQILALKLDHLGDFIIGLPSLRRLRNAFPASHITLVVGSWNRTAAVACGLADVVLAYDYFPQDALGWDGQPYELLEKFQTLTAGHYDIAIDLRVDEDTRHLLALVDAKLRCGIGSQARHTFLDLALPPEHRVRHNTTALDRQTVALSRFESRMPFKHPFFQETDFRAVEGHVIYGPHVTLPPGPITVDFALQLTGWRLGLTRLRRTGWRLGLKKTRVTLDIARNGAEIVALRALHPQDLKALPEEGVSLSFVNDNAAATYEFRIHIAGTPIHTGLRFGGVRLHHAQPARFYRAELHIGEQLSMLVQLVSDRTQALYDPAPPHRAPDGAKHIAVAPFSNSDLRDWPFAHYVELVRLLIGSLECTITLLGSGQQAAALARLASEAGGGDRIRNMGGRTTWADIPELLRQADLVICNNSGIAHMAAATGVRTLAIYSASHQPQEWGPRGQRSHALMAVVACSPCGHDRLEDCPHEHRCMQGLAPETVFSQASALLSDEPSAKPARIASIDTAH